MKTIGQLKGLLLIIAIAGICILVGMVIGSSLSIPDKLSAQSQAPILSSESEAFEQHTVSSVISGQLESVNGHSPFVVIAQKVKPAVVNISAKSVVEEQFHDFFYFNDEIWRRFFGVPPKKPNEPRRRLTESLGSGFFISSDGYILTNNHVIRGADDIIVRLSNTKEFKAEVVGADTETDLALLKIDTKEMMPYLELGDSDSILVGDWAIAVGNPFPQLGLDRTVTVGVVSALGRSGLMFGSDNPVYQNYIQTDASINRGNSGGPLVNINGQVIGINSAIVSTTGGNIGIGFAIPINLAKKVADELKRSGVISRGWLGMLPGNIDNNMAEALGLSSSEGVLVESVEPDSPAQEGGLKVGDIIIEFDDIKVTDAQQFRFMVADAGPGARISLKIMRDEQTKTLHFKLGDRSEFLEMASSDKTEKSETKWLGLSVSTFSQQKAENLGIDFEPGVVIENVEPGSPADDAGLSTGDLIIEIDREPIETKGDFLDMADKLKDRERSILFLIKRGKNTLFKAVKPE
jgi:serine protease Do